MIEFEEKYIDEFEENSNDIPVIYYINTDAIENFLKDEIVFTPFIGRVRHEKHSTKREEYFFDKIDSIEYREKIKDKILKVKDKIDTKKFEELKNLYGSVIPKELINNAMKIKDNNPEYTKDIGKFLFENGIILFVEDLPDKDWERLDGFSCFFNDYPVIVIYKQQDRRRMLFTIMHEVYHLIYNEDEDNADSFAGGSLLTINDLIREYGENYINIIKEEDYKDIIKNLCKKHYISVNAATLALKNYKVLSKEETNYKQYYEELRKEIEKNNIEINIRPIYDFID